MTQRNRRLLVGKAWTKCRRIVLARDSHCWICHQPVDKRIKTPHPASPEVDHVRPLALLPKSMPLAEARRIAADPNGCRLTHRLCNQLGRPAFTSSPAEVQSSTRSREW